MQKLVIIDLCDTLYDANTTIGFIEHCRLAGGSRRMERSLRRWTGRRSPLFYLGAFAHHLLGRDLARQRLVAALAGEPRARLETTARDYATNVLPRHANQPLHDRLAAHRAAGDRVVIVSSSLDIVVAPIAAALGVEFMASTLGFKNDACTGRLERDLTGRKVDIVRDLGERQAPWLTVYTDNRSDQALVAIANDAVIVIPHGRAGTRWGGSDCEYIQL